LEKKKKLAKKQHDKIKEELGNNKLKVISNQMEKYYNDKPDKNDANYLYRIKEEKDKKDIENIEAEKELKYKVGKIIVKSNYKPITREELDEFKQKYESDRQECLLKASRKRATDLEALGELTKIENFPFPETEAKRKVIDEEKENKDNLEKQKLDKIYQAMKIKNFAKVVKENVKPVVDEDKRYEVELRIDRLKNSKNYVSHLHKPKNKRILLHKSNPKHPHQYGIPGGKWKIDLDKSIKSVRASRTLSRNKSLRSQSAYSRQKDYEEKLEKLDKSMNKSSLSIKYARSRSVRKDKNKNKKKPIPKNPDYLTEMMIKKYELYKKVQRVK